MNQQDLVLPPSSSFGVGQQLIDDDRFSLRNENELDLTQFLAFPAHTRYVSKDSCSGNLNLMQDSFSTIDTGNLTDEIEFEELDSYRTLPSTVSISNIGLVQSIDTKEQTSSASVVSRKRRFSEAADYLENFFDEKEHRIPETIESGDPYAPHQIFKEESPRQSSRQDVSKAMEALTPRFAKQSLSSEMHEELHQHQTFENLCTSSMSDAWPRPDSPRPTVAMMMTRLEELMRKSIQSQAALQEYDRQNGLPRSHCQTMVNTSRSRKQLQLGKILPKWNGEPLLDVPGVSISKKKAKKQRRHRDSSDVRCRCSNSCKKN